MGNLVLGIREELRASAEEKYREFHTSLVPGLEGMMGVRMADLRRLAKHLAKGEWQTEWQELSVSCYEELMIKGLVIGYARLSREDRVKYLKKFIPEINNWAICDGTVATWHFIKNDEKYWLEFIKPYFESENEFEVRCAVVVALDYFIKDEFLDLLFKIFEKIRHEGYYVKMAVAWALSVAFVKYPEKTRAFLENNTLDDFVHNKTIQKIRESNRVSREEKDSLLKLKR